MFMAIKFQISYKLPRMEENAIPTSSIKAVGIPALWKTKPNSSVNIYTKQLRVQAAW